MSTEVIQGLYMALIGMVFILVMIIFMARMFLAQSFQKPGMGFSAGYTPVTKSAKKAATTKTNGVTPNAPTPPPTG